MNELRKTVYFALLHGGTMTAKALAERCGLPAASCLRTARQLVALGLAKEVCATANGRTQVKFTAKKTSLCSLGIHLKNDTATLALVSPDGTVTEKAVLARDLDYSEEDGTEQLLNAAEQLINKENREIIGIGVTCPGPMRQQRGYLRQVTDCAGFDLALLCSELKEAFGLPVTLGYDASCAGAYFIATRKDASRGITCCVDTGELITAASFCDGRELKSRGHAGLIAHMGMNFRDERCYCGNRGCLEQYASTAHLYERLHAETLFGVVLQTFDETVALYQSGDPATVKEVDTLSSSLAMGLVNLIWTLEPEHLFLVGDLSKFTGSLERTVHSVIKQRVLPEAFASLSVEISSGELDEYAAGAALTAFGEALAERKK